MRRDIALAHDPDALIVDRQLAVDLGQSILERLSKPVPIGLAEDGLHHLRGLKLGQQRVQRFTPLWLPLSLFAQFRGQFFLGPVVPALDLIGDEVAAHSAHDARQANQRGEITLIGRREHRQQGRGTERAVQHGGRHLPGYAGQRLEVCGCGLSPGGLVHSEVPSGVDGWLVVVKNVVGPILAQSRNAGVARL